MVDLEKLEWLTKIKLTDEEKESALEYFSAAIDKFSALENIDTKNTEPLITVSSLENIMRQDTAFKAFSRETLLENAPDHRDGYFVVPRILE